MASAKGTVRWMAIELLSLSDVSGVGTIPNEKSDVWAFGMTVYVHNCVNVTIDCFTEMFYS